MNYAIGFVVWIILGVVAGLVMPRLYKGVGTDAIVTIVFGLFGSFVGGMLGESAHVYHDPNPLRIGGLIGAVLGAAFFTFLYNFTSRKAV